LSEEDKKSVVKYAILGAGCGLLVGLLYNYLSVGLFFGFALGFIIDGIIYVNRKRT